MNTICYVAGKSGGHIIPALTHAAQELKKNGETRVIFFSTNSPLDYTLLAKNSLIAHHIPLEFCAIPRKNILLWPLFFIILFKHFYHSFSCLRKYRPEKVVSMGGFVSIPVCCCAWVLRIPIELYELNVVPGKAVKLLSHIVTETRICFENRRR